MADDTFVARGINRVWQEGTGEGQEIIKANGTDLVPGYAYTREGETAGTNDIDLCAAGEEFGGIILKTVDPEYGGRVRSLDDAFEDNEDGWGQKPRGFENKVYARMIAGAATSKAGTKLMIASEPGKLTPASVSAGTPGSPSNAELTTMLNTVVAELAEDYTQDASFDTLVKVWI